jgi:hypothetical protein
MHSFHLERPARRRPREIRFPVSLVFIPVLLIAAGLSIPFSLIASSVIKKRERAFRGLMQRSGRIMDWSDFAHSAESNRGTLIEERYSLKGPVRWWWTSEDIYHECPHAIADWLTMSNDPSFRPTAEWFRKRYTSPDGGRAHLVSPEKIQRGDFYDFQSRLTSESGTVRWIAIVAPERIGR